MLEINESYVKTQDDGGFNLGVKHVQGKLSYQDVYSLYTSKFMCLFYIDDNQI